METIGEEIHGGEILCRVRVPEGIMYQYIDSKLRRKREEDLIDEVRKQFRWAPKELRVSCAQTNTDYLTYLNIRLTVPRFVRKLAVEERLKAAENSRCNCGYHGDWECSISGSSDGGSCVWAGCPNCRGTAVGRPIKSSDLEWYERTGKKS